MIARVFRYFGGFAVLLMLAGCMSLDSSQNEDAPLSLERLEGMYYGFRSDTGGYECGGICWDFYTFLPKDKVFIGVPANGGPETIDCKSEECLDYSISNGQLNLSNGESLPIEVVEGEEEDFLVINDVKLDAVKPVPQGTTFDNQYTYMKYTGLIGITGGSSSSTYSLLLRPDGTFELSGVTLGSVGGSSGTSTNAHFSGDINEGTYEIENNTITMISTDGTESDRLLFFIHDGDEDDIQVGEINYYVKED